MEIKTKIIISVFIYSIFISNISAYSISGYVTNNTIGIYDVSINQDLNFTYSNETGYYLLNNVSGNVIINFSKQPQYYLNSTSFNIESNQTIDINIIKKPTGTITGCVFFGNINPCMIIETSLIEQSNRIRWWF